MRTYANTVCTNCAAIHPVAQQLTESLFTKRRAKEVVFQLMQIYRQTGAGAGALTSAERKARFVFGVLVAGGQTFVGVSGTALPANFTLAVGRIPGVTVAGAVTSPVHTFGGTLLKAGTIAACQGEGGNIPLSCAAPKLIVAANALRAAQAFNTPYAMSEVWFDPNQWDRRTVVTDSRKEVKIAEVFTDHGKSRSSCATCQALLPMLMCPH